MLRHLFLFLFGCILFFATGATSLSQVSVVDLKSPVPASPESLPPPPKNRILDQARVFTFDKDIEIDLAATLAKAFEEDNLDVYVAAYSFLLDETIEEHAERLLKEWVSHPRGLVIVYVRGGGQMTFAATEDQGDFLPRLDLEELFGIAAMSARQFEEPSLRLKAAAEQIVLLMSGKIQAKAEMQTLIRPDVLLLGLFALLAIFGIAVLGMALSRLENRTVMLHRFPPVYVHSRFGASNGGGSVGEISFGKGSWGKGVSPLSSRRT